MSADFSEAPFGRIHRRLAVGAAGGYLSDGYTLGVVGIALASSRLGSPWLTGAFGAASLVGLFFGGLGSGVLADRFGRSGIFSYNMFAFALLSVAQALPAPTPALLAIRVGLGIVLGMDYVVCKGLLIELMPRALRGRVLAAMGVAWAGGYSLGYLVGYLMQTEQPDRWRWILASAAVPSILVLPLRLGTPESPYWLAIHGKLEEAQRVVRQIAGCGYQIYVTCTTAVSQSGGITAVFSRARRPLLVGSALYITLVIPYFAVSTFIPEVLRSLHVAGDEFGGLIYNLCLTLGAIAGVALVERCSRRAFMLGSYVLTAAALLGCVWLSGSRSLAVVVMFSVFSCALSAAQTMIYVYLPELFDTSVRGAGVGVCVAASRIGAAVATFLLPVCVHEFGVNVALTCCVAVLVTGGIACYSWAPETSVASTP